MSLNMMGYYNSGMMGGYSHMSGGHSFLCSLIMLVVLVDLILLGMWLWKRIKREDMKLGKMSGCGCTLPCTCKKAEEKKAE